MRIRGAELVAKALEDEKALFAFGIPGTHNIELYDALERSRVAPILVTDEQSASFIADGVARSSDGERVGVVNLVPGAGLTHAMSGIAEALLDNVPMVVLCSGIRTDTGRAYQLHDIDQLALLRPVVKSAVRAETADDLYPLVRQAFRIARSGVPGPAAVEIPANLLMQSHEVSDPEIAFARISPPEPAPAADNDAVARAASLLNGAKRPVIYAGRGAARAAKLLRETAERLEAPVATTIQGKGVFPESHPLWLWNGVGRAAPPYARDLLDRADAALAIGCRFGEVATGSYGWRPPDALVHVDLDPEVLGANYPAAEAVNADAGEFLERLLPKLEPRERNPSLRRVIANGLDSARASQRAAKKKDRVSPAVLFDALQRNAGTDAVYTADSGNGTFLAMEHLRLDEPDRLLAPVDFSCMGYAVPAAIGAKLAAPERDVIALEGDGALLMTGLELLTAVRYGVGVVVCLLRDGELAQIAQFQKTALARQNSTALHGYDAGDFAKTVGCAHFRADRDEEIEGALIEAFARGREGRPTLVEIAIDYSNKTYFTQGVLKTNFLRLSWNERVRMIGRFASRKLGIS
jgi:acetolactate synthase-1/2/3 large subunit